MSSTTASRLRRIRRTDRGAQRAVLRVVRAGVGEARCSGPRIAGKAILVALTLSLFTLLLGSCSANGHQFSYAGQVDVDTITVSSQTSGLIDSVAVREGDTVRKGQLLARINTDRLVAQQKQQQAQLAELAVRHSAAHAQVTQAQARLKLAQETLKKTEKLLATGGVTQQRRDELATQVEADTANLSALQANERLVTAQANELRAGMDITALTIREARITSPIDGVVLNTFHFAGELATMGTPLMELADLSVMTVEIYVPLEKLSSVQVGAKATVRVEGVAKPIAGTVYWVSSEAEFTPKTILTQETKTTLVYGVKIHVPNPQGKLKIGMPVEVGL